MVTLITREERKEGDGGVGKWMDGWVDRQTDGLMNEWLDGEV